MENNESQPVYQSESSSLPRRIPTVGLGLGLMTGNDEDDRNHDTTLQLGKLRLGVVFTVSQLQELQLQWMIYKYIEAGLRVPQTLLVPIWNSFHSAVPFVNAPTLSLSLGTQWREMSRYKKGVDLDDEPGRCRRTDGKKWRCSKESLPDHKYCQKHIHRGRLNRSRKRVELMQ